MEWGHLNSVVTGIEGGMEMRLAVPGTEWGQNGTSCVQNGAGNETS